MLKSMKADHVNVSWDEKKRKWLIRVEVGAEVIRRYCDQQRDVDDGTLRALAIGTVTDEGYESDPNQIAIQR